MPNVTNIRLNRKKPIICIPFSGETVGDICYACQQIMEKPHDIIEYNAANFNGMPNMSTLWNALLMITQVTDEGAFIFKCSRKDLPEDCNSEDDYENILNFAVRCGLPDALEIDGDADYDLIADIAGQCSDSGLIPIITIACDAAPTTTKVIEKLEAFADLEDVTFHLIFPAAQKSDIDAVQAGVREFLRDNYEYRVIIQPTGPVAKAELLSGNTFDSPILYGTVDTETEADTTSTNIRKMLDEKKAATRER